MPVVDMPLEKLREYRGKNPKPADHAEYWDRALAEMRALDAQVELTPAEFQTPAADCFDLRFTGVGGARIYAKYLRPKNVPEPHPAVVMFHGYTGHSGDWYDKLPWIAAGYSVAALDCRGQAGNSQDPGGVVGGTHHGHIIRGLEQGPEHLLFRKIFLDCAQLAGIVMDMPEVDGTRVGALGGSQGGALTLACASLEPRIKRAAPWFPFLSDYQRVWDMDLDQNAYVELRTFLRHRDPNHTRIDEWFRRLGYIDVQHLADRIRGEILMGVTLLDNVCPPSTQFAVFNKITSKKQALIFPDFGHEHLPGWHDRMYQFMLGL